jgi:hypothetical protein
MAKNKLKSSDSKKNYWKRYSTKYEDHRIKRLERHIAKHPEDAQAIERLDNPRFPYRRNVKGVFKTPRINKEKAANREDMKLRELKSRPRSPFPAWKQILRELRDSMRPKVRHKKRRGTKLHKTS